MDRYAFGCFGKLPIYADFIRYQASHTEVRALDRWFQEGIHFSKSVLDRRWPEVFAQSDPWNFVFHSGLSDTFLLGVSFPSRDQSGRTYPFFLFLRVDKKDFGGPLCFAPLCFSLFLKEARKIAATGWQGNTLKAFLSQLEQVKIPAPKDFSGVHEDYSHSLRRCTNQQFWTDLFGDFNDPKKYRLDQNLADILRPVSAYPSRPFRLGLRFPLIPKKLLEEGGEGLDLPFWFDRVSSSLREAPIFFWNRECAKHAPSLLAFFSPPGPKHFLGLIQPELAHDTWVNLASSFVEGQLEGHRKALLDNEALSLAQFLDETRK